jgi:hypothetical protein
VKVTLAHCSAIWGVRIASVLEITALRHLPLTAALPLLNADISSAEIESFRAMSLPNRSTLVQTIAMDFLNHLIYYVSVYFIIVVAAVFCIATLTEIAVYRETLVPTAISLWITWMILRYLPI